MDPQIMLLCILLHGGQCVVRDPLEARRVELNALARVWPRLDEDTRWLLEARYILDYSDSELAREMGVKPTSVRMALTRARKKARAMLRPELEKM